MGAQISLAEPQTPFLNENIRHLGGTLAVGEGKLAVGGSAEVNLANVYPTALTLVTVQVSGNPVRLLAAANVGNGAGPVSWEVPIVTIVKTLPEFLALIGAKDRDTLIRVYNAGPLAAHYKIIFTNLDV